eukprot:COSAG01_NODE_7345_length_3242_cov_6.925867_1_plen_476_part_10
MYKGGAKPATDGSRKTYYVDAHNRPDVVKYRNETYTPRMEEAEDRAYVWMYLNEAENKELQEHHAAQAAKLAADHPDRCQPVPPTPRRWVPGPDGTGTFAEYHIDDSEAFNALRSTLPHGGMLKSGMQAHPDKPSEAEWTCKFQHSYDVCRCHLPVQLTGQDESAYHGNEMSTCHWKVDEHGKLRKKGKGQTEMVSAFTDQTRGLALPLSATELQQVNDLRRTKYGRPPLTESPGVRYLQFGKDKDTVWWNNEQMVQQTVDYMDAAEVIYPDMQLHMEFDWSSGHSRRSDDGLAVASMNWGYGGKQQHLRPSKLTAACIGPYPTVYDGHDYAVKAGETQQFTYGVSTPEHPVLPPAVPKSAQGAPRHDIVDGATGKTIRGFEGKPKGIAQILFETGWWNPNDKMVGSMPRLHKLTGKRYDNGKDPPTEDMVGELVLAARADFLQELSELAKVSSFSFLLVSGSTPERSACPPPPPP